MSIAVLAGASIDTGYFANQSLKAALATWNSSGLTAAVSPGTLLLQNMADKGDHIAYWANTAREVNLSLVLNADNEGIAGGVRMLMLRAKTPLVLFLEKDWQLRPERADIWRAAMQDAGTLLMRGDVPIVYLRDWTNANGTQCIDGRCKLLNGTLPSVNMNPCAQMPCMGGLFGAGTAGLENATRHGVFRNCSLPGSPVHITCSTSAHIRYTNNPAIIRRDFWIQQVEPWAAQTTNNRWELILGLDVGAETWPAGNFPVAVVSPGLFIHKEIDGRVL